MTQSKQINRDILLKGCFFLTGTMLVVVVLGCALRWTHLTILGNALGSVLGGGVLALFATRDSKLRAWGIGLYLGRWFAIGILNEFLYTGKFSLEFIRALFVNPRGNLNTIALFVAFAAAAVYCHQARGESEGKRLRISTIIVCAFEVAVTAFTMIRVALGTSADVRSRIFLVEFGACLAFVVLTVVSAHVLWQVSTMGEGTIKLGTGAKVWIAICIGMTTFAAVLVIATRSAEPSQVLMPLAAVVGYILLFCGKRQGFCIAVLAVAVQTMVSVRMVLPITGNLGSGLASALVGGLNPLVTWLFIHKAWSQGTAAAQTPATLPVGQQTPPTGGEHLLSTRLRALRPGIAAPQVQALLGMPRIRIDETGAYAMFGTPLPQGAGGREVWVHDTACGPVHAVIKDNALVTALAEPVLQRSLVQEAAEAEQRRQEELARQEEARKKELARQEEARKQALARQEEARKASGVRPMLEVNFTLAGVCDVCARPITSLNSWFVPNPVFYASPAYHNFIQRSGLMFGTDVKAYLRIMQAQDQSPGSAVCENCVSMFR